ncbi:hypothetical protein AVDCRST_MAG94-2898, partial [uncultured Leptolyngbya sp.]
EATLFALAPLPLQYIKTGIQQVAVPFLVTAGVSRIPGVDHLIGSAIDHGDNFMAAGGKAIACADLSVRLSGVSLLWQCSIPSPSIRHGYTVCG